MPAVSSKLPMKKREERRREKNNKKEIWFDRRKCDDFKINDDVGKSKSNARQNIRNFRFFVRKDATATSLYT